MFIRLPTEVVLMVIEDLYLADLYRLAVTYEGWRSTRFQCSTCAISPVSVASRSINHAPLASSQHLSARSSLARQSTITSSKIARQVATGFLVDGSIICITSAR